MKNKIFGQELEVYQTMHVYHKELTTKFFRIQSELMNILIKSLYRYESQSNNSLLALKHLPKCARENLKKSIQTDVAKVMAS